MIPGQDQLTAKLAVFIPQIVMCHLDDSSLVYVHSSWQVYIPSEHARFGVNIF
jgi:hypothetical protein